MSSSLNLSAARIYKQSVRLPGSKSISNRVLLLAALSKGSTEVKNLLHSDDTHYMLGALKQLGIKIEETSSTSSGSLLVQGSEGTFSNQTADLFLGNAGTAYRPLTAALAMQSGAYTLDGVPRMHERPIGDLVDALRIAGANIEYLKNTGFPPLKIGTFSSSGSLILPIKGNVSSQFLTALLMALPLAGKPYEIVVDGELISKPYIAITLKLMAQFGVDVKHDNYQHFWLPENTPYQAPKAVFVEGDASSASYFMAAALLSDCAISVEGVGKNSIQGDVAFANELAKIGADVTWGDDFIKIQRQKNKSIQAFDLDLNHIPDAAMTLAIVALAANGTSTLRNIASWRVKETDRIAAMATELRKLGATIVKGEDFIQITPPKSLNPNVKIDTYDDHRMAMCFSLVSLLGTPITINDPTCVAKTFPDYFEVFQTLCHMP